MDFPWSGGAGRNKQTQKQERKNNDDESYQQPCGGSAANGKESGREKEKVPLHPLSKGKKPDGVLVEPSVALRVGVENFHFAVEDKFREDAADGTNFFRPPAVFQAYLNRRFPRGGAR